MEKLALGGLGSLMERPQHPGSSAFFYIQSCREAGSLIQLNKEAGLAKLQEQSLLGSSLQAEISGRQRKLARVDIFLHIVHIYIWTKRGDVATSLCLT